MLTRMRLSEIASLIGAPFSTAEDPEITDLSYDSREVSAGALFFCIPGDKLDRHDLAAEAIESGASGLVVNRVLELDIPQFVVPDVRRTMNLLAAPFFEYPSRDLKVVGVTGTNGKTTTTYMVDAIARAAGERTGLIGTIERRFGRTVLPAPIGTPESSDLQRMFRQMVNQGIQTCVVEVTSIGINEGRIDGTDFDVSVFTNLSQDHLDYHSSMEDYYEAKRDLFTQERTSIGLVNIDDEWGRRLALQASSKVLTYARERDADFVATQVESLPNGSTFVAEGPDMKLPLTVQIPAEFNVMNALAAASAARLIGLPDSAIASGLRDLRGVPGRFEKIEQGQDFLVIVDFAHTPDGLENVLRFARRICKERIRLVFGCGGDRDHEKRPLMGAVAGSLADRVYVTSDNPRSENPQTIINEIVGGLMKAPPRDGHVALLDRAEAIALAIKEAEQGDVVLIAGKGHETGQEFADSKIPFDDREVARAALRR